MESCLFVGSHGFACLYKSSSVAILISSFVRLKDLGSRMSVVRPNLAAVLTAVASGVTSAVWRELALSPPPAVTNCRAEEIVLVPPDSVEAAEVVTCPGEIITTAPRSVVDQVVHGESWTFESCLLATLVAWAHLLYNGARALRQYFCCRDVREAPRPGGGVVIISARRLDLHRRRGAVC